MTAPKVSQPNIDPITIEVLRNRFDAIANRMQATLQKCGYSTVIKEGADCSVALFDRAGNTIAQGLAIPLHLGSLGPTVKSILRHHPLDALDDGDAIIANDPYLGTQHLPDVVVLSPIFVGGRPVAMAAALAHQQDVGGKSPGSTPTDATEIYQEGLCIPPVKILERGKMNPTVEAFIRRNVRVPDLVIGDINAQLAAVRVASSEMSELFAAYGADVILTAIDDLLARAEVQTRSFIQDMPDGSYEFTDWLDNDGIDLDTQIPIKVRVTIRGSEISFDFTGTGRQVKGPFNAVPAVTLSAVRYVIRAITDPNIPNNEGCYRMIHLTLPEGSILNPRHPAAVNSRSTTLRRIGDAVLGALAQALPERIPAASNGHPLWAMFGGYHPETGRPYIATEIGTGGMGARPTLDGIDCIATDSSNAMNLPVELIELTAPLRVSYYRIRRDSGGAGFYRGGCGFEKEYVALVDGVQVSHRGERHYSQPWGLKRGLPGASSRSVIVRANGKREVIPSKMDFVMDRNDRLVLHTSGGGGFGDPRTRPPALVVEDVLDSKVSVRCARALYGVEIKGGRIQPGRTEALRSGNAAADTRGATLLRGTGG